MSAESEFINNLTTVELIEILDIYSAASTLTDEINCDIKRIASKLHEAYNNILEAERDKNRQQRLLLAKDVAKQISAYYARFIKNYMSLYSVYSGVFGAVYNTQELRKRIEWDIDPKYIKAAVTSTQLMVRLPHIPIKTFFRASVLRDVLKTQLDKQFSEGMPIIEKKIIRILHIYPTTVHKWQVPDNDNYYIKDIVDIVTDYIGGGDGSLNCSIFQETTLSDELPEGSYIIVSPNNDGIEPTISLLQTLKTTLK